MLIRIDDFQDIVPTQKSEESTSPRKIEVKSRNTDDGMEDEDSMVLDYSHLLLPSVTVEPKTDQKSIPESTTKSLPTAESLKINGVSATDAFFSPVLSNRMNVSTKRTHSDDDVMEWNCIH